MYVAFFRLRESAMLSQLVVLFLIVLGGLFLQDGALVNALGLPSVVAAQASIATELFSQFLFWVAMIAAMRLGGVSPYRAVGVAEGCMSAAALLLVWRCSGAGPSRGWWLLRLPTGRSSSCGTCCGARSPSVRPAPRRCRGRIPLRAPAKSWPPSAACPRRETEVLYLLAQGRSRTFIQSELYLSDGTVKTHIRHIYQKLDVHSKQELISLIQNS